MDASSSWTPPLTSATRDAPDPAIEVETRLPARSLLRYCGGSAPRKVHRGGSSVLVSTGDPSKAASGLETIQRQLNMFEEDIRRVYPEQFPVPSRRPHAAEFPSVRRPESLTLFQGLQALVHQPRVPLMQLVARIRAIVHGQGRMQPVSHRDFCAALQLLMESRQDSAILAIPFQARLLNDDRVLSVDADSTPNAPYRVDHGGGGGGPCVQDRHIYVRVEQPLNSGDTPTVTTVCIPKADLEQARVLVEAKFVCSQLQWFSAGQTLPFVTEGLLHSSAANVAQDELLQAKAAARRVAPTSVAYVSCSAGVSPELLPYALVMPHSPDEVCNYFEHPYSEALTFSCSAGLNSFSFTDTFFRRPLVSIAQFQGPSAKISAWTSSLLPYAADRQAADKRARALEQSFTKRVILYVAVRMGFIPGQFFIPQAIIKGAPRLLGS
ncbi:hypothetical protein T484DRAFT_3630703, partial [Baffinella frigidus]